MNKASDYISMAEITKCAKFSSDGTGRLVFTDRVPRERQLRITQILDCLTEGSRREQARDLEAAFAKYNAAAEMGSIDAPRMIANLYIHEFFRPVKVSAAENIARSKQPQGGLVYLPTVTTDSLEPNYKRAFEYYCKGAELGDPESLHNVGAMLLRGFGCQKDEALAKTYLRKAMDKGLPISFAVYNEYFGPEEGVRLPFQSDEAYFEQLKAFKAKADRNDPQALSDVDVLKLGTDRQLARLGYVVARGKYNTGGVYNQMNCCWRRTGEPHGCVYFYYRLKWITYIKIDLDAFEEDAFELSFACGIDWVNPEPTRWMRKTRTIEYTSGAFGFLGEHKKATVFKVNKAFGDTYGSLDSLPFDQEWKDRAAASNATFLYENGDKEYSVEICQIVRGQPVILCRYTIDKFDTRFDQGDRASTATLCP